MDKIKRKTLVYKTGVEYGDYTLNHVFGCSHGCKYPCYAFQMMRRFKKVESYDEWCNPKVVENAMELFRKELPKYKGKIKMLHLCFSTDPFMFNIPQVGEMSVKLLKEANKENISCSVLTKGILPKELDSLSKNNEYGITLVSIDEEFRKKMEPGAAPIDKRIAALKYLSEKGFKTWISMEPYPTPNFINQNILEILEKVNFVDRIIFGRMHYNKKVSEYKQYKCFYNRCAKIVKSFCEANDIECYIKKGTVTEKTIAPR